MSLLTGYLQDISVSNGYITDMGSDISHWATQTVPRDKASQMWANIKDEVNEHAPGHLETLVITVELGCKTSTNYTTVTNMVQDVQKCFENKLYTLCQAIGDDVMRWYAISETVSVEREGDAEFGRATIIMNLLHKADEKWTLDETEY